MFIQHTALPIAAAVVAVAVPPALTNPPAAGDEVQQLRSMVADMQKQIDQLKAASSDHWITQERANEIRGLVQDVLADADTRASLLQGGAVAGWDNGFFLASSDGNFRLKIGGQFQQRFVYNMQDNSPSDDHRWGFEVRRARVLLSGHIVDPSWTYDMQLAVDRSTGNMQLEDFGYIQKDFGNGVKMRAGQMKAPFLREETLSSIRMLAIERSLVNAQFTAGTVQGVQVGWEGDQFRAYAMYHDGNRTANTAWSAEDTEFAFSARAEWLASGDWRNFLDYTSFRDQESGVLVGAAINYSRSEFGTSLMPGPPPIGNDAEVDNFGLTADVTVDFGGASLAAMIVYRNLETDTGTPADIDVDQYGFFIRGGYFLTDEWELYGQYEWGDLDISGVEDLSVLTIGATRYWAKHNLKWQNDIGFALDEVSPMWASDGAGWRGDAPDEDGQIVFRSQWQLVF